MTIYVSNRCVVTLNIIQKNNPHTTKYGDLISPSIVHSIKIARQVYNMRIIIVFSFVKILLTSNFFEVILSANIKRVLPGKDYASF